MSGKRLLAVDLGASGGKCFAGEFNDGAFTMTEVHRFAHECVSFFLPGRDGRVTERTVWDDTLIYANIVEGLRAFRRNMGETLDGIGIDAWGADGNFITPDGDFLGKVYAYRDHRLDSMTDELKARIDAKRIYEITGIHFQPFNVSNQILWFMLNRRNLLQPGCRYLPVPSLFHYFLGGVTDVDSSWASVTQLMDARTRRWSPEIFEKLGLPIEAMPRIVAPGTDIGRLHRELAESLRLNRARLIAVGAHDTASAFAAAPVSDTDGALIISSGTWSLVGKLVPEPVTSPQAMEFNLSNEGGIGNIRLLRNCMGGWLAHELRRAWRDEDGREMEWPEIYEAAGAAPAFAAFIDPDDASFYNPKNMEAAMAEACRKTGQEPPATRGGMLRMVYESLALKYRMISEAISGASGKPTRTVHIVGGGSRNEMLNRFTANALHVPVIAGPVEATAVGNLMVQAVGLGLIRGLREALPVIRRAFPIRDFKPGEGEAWDRAYARFRTIAKC